MLGGGSFYTTNKVLPGTYIKFETNSSGINVFGERGTAAVGYYLSYNISPIIEITRDEFYSNSLKIFGYEYYDIKMLNIREVFRCAKKLIAFNLAYTSGTAATCKYCTALARGPRGNSFNVVISTNVDNTSKKDVMLYLDGKKVFEQTVSSAAELKNSNGYVRWTASATLENTAGTKLTGGTSGVVSGSSINNVLTALEGYSFNSIAICTDDSEFEELLISYTKRCREELGKKFQCVVCNTDGDYEGCITSFSSLNDDDDCNLNPWVAAAIAACPVNKSLTNALYTGEHDIYTKRTQSYFENCIDSGYFVFHDVNGETRVLMDINSLVAVTADKGEDFKDNQIIRLCDQIANDITEIFNNYYLGKVPNDTAGRNSLWSDIVKHHERLLELRAIDDFDEKSITIEKGESKNSVIINDCITPSGTMVKLYMTVNIN